MPAISVRNSWLSSCLSLNAIHILSSLNTSVRNFRIWTPLADDHLRICASSLHDFRTPQTTRAYIPTEQSHTRTLCVNRRGNKSMPAVGRSCSSCNGLSGHGVRIGLHDDCLDNLLLFWIENFCETFIELWLLLLQFLKQACQ